MNYEHGAEQGDELAPPPELPPSRLSPPRLSGGSYRVTTDTLQGRCPDREPNREAVDDEGEHHVNRGDPIQVEGTDRMAEQPLQHRSNEQRHGTDDEARRCRSCVMATPAAINANTMTG